MHEFEICFSLILYCICFYCLSILYKVKKKFKKKGKCLKKKYHPSNRNRKKVYQIPTLIIAKIVSKQGIEPNFLNLVENIFQKSTANIVCNSKNLKNFPLRASARQGCLLLPLLFSIIRETLARAIKWGKEIYRLERKK